MRVNKSNQNNATISLTRIATTSARNVYTLLIIDVQYCFINGSLALSNSPAHQNGAEVIPVINNLIKTVPFDVFAYSLDWHPANHISFFENLKSRQQYVLGGNYKKYKVFDTVTYTGPKYETQQMLWPAHCIQNTNEARLDDDLISFPEGRDVIYIKKGIDSDIDSYSAFVDNNRLKKTPLDHELKARHVTHVFVAGLALDYCVGSTALDAVDFNYTTYVIEDASRGVADETIQKKLIALKRRGVGIVQSSQVNGLINRTTRNSSVTKTLSPMKYFQDIIQALTVRKRDQSQINDRRSFGGSYF
jgi:nicotinamidase-related amidase